MYVGGLPLICVADGFFGDVFTALKQDLRPIYDRVKALPDHAPDTVLCRDCVYWRGTGAWKKRKQAS